MDWIQRVLCWGLILGMAGGAWAATDQGKSADTTEKKVEQALDIRQDSQKAQEKWDGRQAKLLAQYHQLKAENEALKTHRDQLAGELKGLEELNLSLVQRKAENIRIQKEMMPFLTELTARLDGLVQGDTPFLARERRSRMARLREVMTDPEIGVAEKYRKAMEALAVEAEYGRTIEVYQDKVMLAGEEVLGNIFRLGRVSLFFLSLDQARAAGFNVATGEWALLDSAHIPAVFSCLEIAAKRRPAELVSLPLGSLAGGAE